MISEERTIGPKGQVVIPKIFRDHLGIVSGEKVEIGLKNNRIYIQKEKRNVKKDLEVFANMAKKIEINSDKNYDERMKERWKKRM